MALLEPNPHHQRQRQRESARYDNHLFAVVEFDTKRAALANAIAEPLALAPLTYCNPVYDILHLHCHTVIAAALGISDRPLPSFKTFFTPAQNSS